MGHHPRGRSGQRIQPLAFSKELLPVGSRSDGAVERPRAVSEYLVERMLQAGATKICFVIAPGKSDILGYYAGGLRSADVFFAVQPQPAGLCDAIFRALPLVHPDEHALAGLPDTIWFPVDGLRALGDAPLSFLLFPVEQPELFDAVVTRPDERVARIDVKRPAQGPAWIWGAFKARGAALRELHRLWERRRPRDEYVGTLVNAWLEAGGEARGVRAGESYVDVGTLHGWREAMELLGRRVAEPEASAPRRGDQARAPSASSA